MSYPEIYNPQDTINYCKMLIAYDEVERALMVLDNVPARFREMKPKELMDFRAEILGAMCTPHAYAYDHLDMQIEPEKAKVQMEVFPRLKMVKAEVEKYNKQGLVPHVVDVGPGEFNVPLGLKSNNLNFTYWDVAMCLATKMSGDAILKELGIKEHKLKHTPTIFVANEIIEHLPDPRDLAVECLRHCGEWPERIHLSTPMFTFDVKHRELKKNQLPHLRAYTPQEFYIKAGEIFPGYQWQLYTSEIMSLRGTRSDKLDPEAFKI